MISASRFAVAWVLCWLMIAPIVDAREPAKPKQASPNVLIFLIDDLGRSDLAADGSPFHETPNLDALARSGVRFTDFYWA